MNTTVLLVIAVLLCCKQEDRGRALSGMFLLYAACVLAARLLPLGLGGLVWLSQGNTTINPALLLGAMAVGIGAWFYLHRRTA